jgi:hypothetical protein
MKVISKSTECDKYMWPLNETFALKAMHVEFMYFTNDLRWKHKAGTVCVQYTVVDGGSIMWTA